uniref:OSJNBa0085C10.18 protein n=1 Tax=Oryza sativa subsp. japonica TaxID=39947 RepID=Q7XWH6_ORYSJ|nr:OSJNBa0085C10.18 [Oryza sativa Japonica Group]
MRMERPARLRSTTLLKRGNNSKAEYNHRTQQATPTMQTCKGNTRTEKAFADVSKGNQRRQAGPARQRHKGAAHGGPSPHVASGARPPGGRPRSAKADRTAGDSRAARLGQGTAQSRPSQTTARGGAARGRRQPSARHHRQRRGHGARSAAAATRSDDHRRRQHVARTPGRRPTKGRKRERKGSAHRDARRRRGGRRQGTVAAGLLRKTSRRSSGDGRRSGWGGRARPRSATEEGGAPADFRRRGAAAEVLLVLAELREATARVGVDRSGGATRLESAASGGERLHGGEVFRWWFGGKRVEAGARHGEAKPTAHTARRGGGWGGGKRRPVNSGERRLLGLARGERARAPGARESWGNGRGDHGDRFYWLGAVGSWPRRAESTGNGLRSGLRRRGRSGVVRRRFWRGKVGEESGGGGATRSRGQGERAGGGGGGIGGDVGRPWRRFRLREPEPEPQTKPYPLDMWKYGSALQQRPEDRSLYGRGATIKTMHPEPSLKPFLGILNRGGGVNPIPQYSNNFTVSR